MIPNTLLVLCVSFAWFTMLLFLLEFLLLLHNPRCRRDRFASLEWLNLLVVIGSLCCLLVLGLCDGLDLQRREGVGRRSGRMGKQ